MTATGGAPQMRRWNEQRWLLDNVVQAVGADWDSPRLAHLNAALGPELTADINIVRQRVKKFADIENAFVAVARRREARAKACEEAGEFVTARENYYMASNYWASAQWPIDVSSEQNHFYNRRKRECYEKYALWVPKTSSVRHLDGCVGSLGDDLGAGYFPGSHLFTFSPRVTLGSQERRERWQSQQINDIGPKSSK